MDENKLKDILEKHKKFLEMKEEGEKADLREADLREADLSGANLREADLRWADLLEADLSGANLDYSSLPFSCRTASSKIKVCDKIASQLLYHALIVTSPNNKKLITNDILDFIEQNFHRYNEVEKLEKEKENGKS